MKVIPLATPEEAFEIAVLPGDDVRAAKLLIRSQRGVPAKYQALLDADDGHELRDSDTLDGVASVTLTYSLAGGCGTKCLGCTWYGPCFKKETDGPTWYGCCELM
eukprot:m51a1_g12670 hypothetical protein (105) ;mRNA; r:134-663